MTAPLPDYRLKIERARVHIKELTTQVQAFHRRKPYRIFTQDDLEAGQRVWKVNIREDIPQDWSMIVGDAIHNIRASLDLLMCAVVRRCSPAKSLKHVYFVIRETKQLFADDVSKT